MAKSEVKMDFVKDKILLTPHEAGLLTGISENLIRDLCKYEELPHLTTNESEKVYFKIGKQALLDWIDNACKKRINIVQLVREKKRIAKQAA